LLVGYNRRTSLFNTNVTKTWLCVWSLCLVSLEASRNCTAQALQNQLGQLSNLGQSDKRWLALQPLVVLMAV
jgi:hypothetical protein